MVFLEKKQVFEGNDDPHLKEMPSPIELLFFFLTGEAIGHPSYVASGLSSVTSRFPGQDFLFCCLSMFTSADIFKHS